MLSSLKEHQDRLQKFTSDLSSREFLVYSQYWFTYSCGQSIIVLPVFILIFTSIFIYYSHSYALSTVFIISDGSPFSSELCLFVFYYVFYMVRYFFHCSFASEYSLYNSIYTYLHARFCSFFVPFCTECSREPILWQKRTAVYPWFLFHPDMFGTFRNLNNLKN